jgi:hypothetical protein
VCLSWPDGPDDAGERGPGQEHQRCEEAGLSSASAVPMPVMLSLALRDRVQVVIYG